MTIEILRLRHEQIRLHRTIRHLLAARHPDIVAIADLRREEDANARRLAHLDDREARARGLVPA